MRRLLGFGVKRDRFRKIALLAIGGSQNRIQIKVIWIELERSLAFNNCVVNAVVSQIRGSHDVANDRRYRIQFLSLQDQLKTVLYFAAEEWVQSREEVSRCGVGIELERALQLFIRTSQIPVEDAFRFTEIAMRLSIFLV